MVRTSESTNDGSVPPPVDGDYDCSSHDTLKRAQTILDQDPSDPHRLDPDNKLPLVG